MKTTHLLTLNKDLKKGQKMCKCVCVGGPYQKL